MTGNVLAPATAEQIAAARAAADTLGLYFKLADPAAADHPSQNWRPATLLYEPEPATGSEPATDPGPLDPLDELLDSVRATLGGCERRVAASLFFQGYAARLLSPQLACLATGGCLPELPAGRLTWRRPATEMIELALPPSPGWRGPAPALLDQLLIQSFTAHLRPLATAIRTRVRISAGLLQDNAASALISGLRLLGPQLAGSDWRPLATQALASQDLRGSGTLRASEPAFVRRGCCLYYRTQAGIQAGGLCGDCPLARNPGTI